ncbi:MAG: BREX-2 system adenine-specific DNA-methyltransferase PglX, partial [Deltaproteobacteria bacterium]|nr:BREX-2 system adenine-specific DNA-methyltransferase PglX [Deltaproteobacteria bacterium]
MTASVHTHLRPLQDPKALTKALEKVALALGKDLVERSKDARIEPMLKADHAAEVESNRVGLSFPDWRNLFCDQVAASWVLCTVFVRTLEDRGFLPHRIAGPGASDRLAQFRQQFRFLTERDYLRHIFDALSLLPAGNEVFGAEHAPLWKLSPSQGALADLLDVLRATHDDETLVYTFARAQSDDKTFDRDGASTRYLGDLYQDLNEGVRKRYALLQTPDFVEHFILDQTLTPAMKERGLDVTVLDPTCGSGHFLLGAYDRLFDAKMAAAPGLPAAEHARAALDQVYGIDLNPYAAAIARFRLMLAYLDKSGVTSLSAVSDSLPIHIFVGDSLLSGKLGADQGKSQQYTLGDSLEKDGKSADEVGFDTGLGYSFLDPATDELLKATRFDVVVANPPYITEKDAKKRDVIRDLYKGAKGKFALSAPFVERIFQLADDGGWTGQITSNSFMKREFGKSLIEEVMPSIDLSLVIDTSGAYIPGHGTPTVLLFGRNRQPLADQVDVVMGNRGEPSTPEEAFKGKVWTSITEHYAEPEYEDDYITQSKISRVKLGQHPWSLSGGGAAELKDLLEERAETKLEDIGLVGVLGMTNADDCMLSSSAHLKRQGVEPRFIRKLFVGDKVRDWGHSDLPTVVYPYEWPEELLDEDYSKGLFRYLWSFRTTMGARVTFNGGTYHLDGLPWWKWHQVAGDRLRTPLSITFAFVASHNHFVLDRGGKVFKQSAPIIKLPDDATEDDHLVLLGYLNSSVACFYLKQITQMKQMTAGDSVRISEKGKVPREFSGKAVEALPVPDFSSTQKSILELVCQLELLAQQRGECDPVFVIENSSWGSASNLQEAFAKAKKLEQKIFQK